MIHTLKNDRDFRVGDYLALNDLYDAKTQELIERVIEWCSECAIPAIKKMIDVLVPRVQELINAIAPFSLLYKNKTEFEALIKSYPNKRVLHLAKYCPKERVRKKNMHRVLKWVEKGG